PSFADHLSSAASHTSQIATTSQSACGRAASRSWLPRLEMPTKAVRIRSFAPITRDGARTEPASPAANSRLESAILLLLLGRFLVSGQKLPQLGDNLGFARCG